MLILSLEKIKSIIIIIIITSGIVVATNLLLTSFCLFALPLPTRLGVVANSCREFDGRKELDVAGLEGQVLEACGGSELDGAGLTGREDLKGDDTGGVNGLSSVLKSSTCLLGFMRRPLESFSFSESNNSLSMA